MTETTHSKPSVSVLQVLSSAAGVGLLLGLVDLALAWAHGPRSISNFIAVLPTFALAGIIGLGAFLAVWVCGRALRLDPRHLVLAAAAGMLAAELDLVLLRRNVAFWFPSRAWPSLIPGVLLGILVYFTRSRSRASRIPAATFARAAGSSKLALIAFPALALASVLPWILPSRAEASATRAVRAGHRIPRVLLIVVDTLRNDALSCAAQSAPPTPHIDRLAEQSYRFSRARSPAPWTLPSVSSLLTGLSPLVHRAVGRDSVLPRSVPTIAERLAAAGYRTAAIGHNDVLSPTRELNRGFDEYLFSEREMPPARTLGFLAWGLVRSKKEFDAKALSERAGAWIEEHADQDFFLWLHYYDPHLDYSPPASFLPNEAPPARMDRRLDSDAFKGIRSGHLDPKPDERRWIRALYDAEVRYLDQEIGALLERLKEKGLYEDTLVVLTSDHGEEFWEHEGFEHGHTVYEELLRVPLIVKLPAQREGGLVEQVVTHESIVPSILTLCGVEHDSADFSASSLFQVDGTLSTSGAVPALLGTGTLYYQDRLSLLFGGWKYVRLLSTGREELFDLEADPSELLSRSSYEPEKLAEARMRCEQVLQAAQGLRERYGVSEGRRESLPQDELERLRGLGYTE